MSMDDRSRASSRSADGRARHARAPAIAAGCAAVALAGLAAATHSAWLAIAAVMALVLAVRLTLRVRALGDPVISASPFLAAQLAVSGFYATLAFGTCCSPVSIGSALAAAAMLFVAAGLWFSSLRPFALVVATAGHAAALVVWPSWPLAFTSLLVLGSSILFLDDRPGSRLVVWDDTCGFCRSSVTLLRRLDWLHVHRFAGIERRASACRGGSDARRGGRGIEAQCRPTHAWRLRRDPRHPRVAAGGLSVGEDPDVPAARCHRARRVPPHRGEAALRVATAVSDRCWLRTRRLRFALLDLHSEREAAQRRGEQDARRRQPRGAAARQAQEERAKIAASSMVRLWATIVSRQPSSHEPSGVAQSDARICAEG